MKNIGVGVIGRRGDREAPRRELRDEGPRGFARRDRRREPPRSQRARVEAGRQDRLLGLQQLLCDPNVDAIVVATPPFLKKDITLAAADRHKHVFCEKPMTLSLKDADEMIAAVQRSGIVFQVGYQKRSDISFMQARKAIETGELGKITPRQGTQQGPADDDRGLVGRPQEERRRSSSTPPATTSTR